MSMMRPARHEGSLDGVVDVMLRERMASPMPSPHRHGSLEFNLVLTGTARYLLEDRRYELGPQTLVWLFPAQGHVMTDASRGYRDWLGLVPRDDLRRACTQRASAPLLQADPPGHFARRLSAAATARLDGLLAQVSTLSGDARRAGVIFALLAAWDAFQAADEVDPGGNVHPAVVRVARLVSEPGSDRSVAELAERVGLSASHLSRLFRAQMGIGLARYRNETRFRRFLDLTRDRSLPMLDAAHRAGFGSSAQFYRVFAELTGQTPAEYLATAGWAQEGASRWGGAVRDRRGAVSAR